MNIRNSRRQFFLLFSLICNSKCNSKEPRRFPNSKLFQEVSIITLLLSDRKIHCVFEHIWLFFFMNAEDIRL